LQPGRQQRAQQQWQPSHEHRPQQQRQRQRQQQQQRQRQPPWHLKSCLRILYMLLAFQCCITDTVEVSEFGQSL
jgi:hypothetical protein